MKDEWKCVLKEDGERCLMMDGVSLMLELYADNWAIAHSVIIIIYCHLHWRMKGTACSLNSILQKLYNNNKIIAETG